MRSPSAKVLINRADLFVAVKGRDVEGGATYTYNSSPTYGQVSCTAQAQGFVEVIDEQQRITQMVEWKLMFASPYMVSPRDKILYMDQAGVIHTLFVEATRDEAGRGAAFTIRAMERV